VKADGRLVALPLEPSLLRQIGLVRRRDKPLSPPLAAVLECARRSPAPAGAPPGGLT
jgi:hypothetical protein